MKVTSWDALPLEAVSHNPCIRKQVMVRGGEMGSIVQLAQARFPVGAVAAGHVHDDLAELFLVQSGSGEIEIDGVVQVLEPGVGVLVEAGEWHELRNRGDEELVVIYFAVRID